MEETHYEELLNLVQSYSKNNTPWHHHFLTTKCMFNQQEKFQIILENEESGESVVCLFDTKPTKELEQIENIFFKR